MIDIAEVIKNPRKLKNISNWDVHLFFFSPTGMHHQISLAQILQNGYPKDIDGNPFSYIETKIEEKP